MSIAARCFMALIGVLAVVAPARAAIFEDDEARKAILEVRQRMQAVEQINTRQNELIAEATKTNAQLLEQVQTLKRSLLELNGQLESLRGEMANLRGGQRGLRPLEKQLHRFNLRQLGRIVRPVKVGHRQGLHGEFVLAVETQRNPTGGQHLQVRAGGHQFAERR